MWKTIVLCASLFGGGAAGLAAAARWMEPAALPMTAALGLCLIGIVLILAAPTSLARDEDDTLPAARLRGALARSREIDPPPAGRDDRLIPSF
jgi:hypothetical protein